MIRYFVVLSIVLLLILFTGCGGAEAPSAKKETSRNVSPGQSTPSSADANTNITNPAPASSGQANVGENPTTLTRNKKIDAMREAGKDPNAPKPDIEAILRQSTRPAPENSEFSVALTDILVERRTFLKDPLLAKVEKTTEGEKSTIRVFLKDGRTKDLPGESINPVSTVSIASILKAAGVSARASQTLSAKPKGAVEN